MPDFKLYQSYLFEADDPAGSRLAPAAVFAVYTVLLAVGVAHHEPWMDEAQAWLLVKDASLAEVFAKHLRYEGSPGLWHLILAVPAGLGLPYFTINLISASLSAFAVWLFLYRSPFPLAVKILFPFSYFILYQYSVVARSYSLVAPLLFLIAVKFKTRLEKPLLFSLLLCLLANVSAHTFLIAGGIMAVHLLDAAKRWKDFEGAARVRQLAALALFAATNVFILLVLAPPSDHFLDGGYNLRLVNFLNSSKWAISAALVMDESSPLRNAQVWLSLGIFVITVVWLRQKKLALWYLFPLFLLLMLFAVKYRNLWHDGITFFLWVSMLWVGFDRAKNEKPMSALTKLVPGLVAVVLATQIYWSFYVVRNDFYQSYSGSAEVAAYLRENNLENRKIYASGWKSIAVHPYFDRNIFYNHNLGSEKRFWVWTVTNQTALGAHPGVIAAIQTDQPDVVIFASDHLDLNAIQELKGYHLEQVFPGYLFWKTGIHEINAFWLFRKNEPEEEEVLGQ